MAGPYNPPIKNTAYETYVSLRSFATPGSLQANPTLAAGDVKLYIDGVASTLGAGSSANLVTLPTVVDTTVVVKVNLSSSEMNADNVTVVFIDQTATKEWEDLAVNIQTAASSSALDAAGVRSALGMASANLDTQLGAIDDFVDTEVAAILAAVDTEVAAIKAKTDNLPAAPAATSDILTTAQIKAALLATIHSGVAQGAGAGADTLQLASGGVSSDDEFNGYVVAIVAGAGKGQQRQILDSINTGDYIQVVGGNWETAVDNTSVYVLFAN